MNSSHQIILAFHSKCRNKRHSELRINEDLQKLIMLLLCGMKRVIKYLNDTKALTKYLKRMAKRHSPLTEVDFGRINPAEVASVFCSALREIAPDEKDTWTQEVSHTEHLSRIVLYPVVEEQMIL